MALFKTYPWTRSELNLSSIDIALAEKIQLFPDNPRLDPAGLTSDNGTEACLLPDIRPVHVKPDTIIVQMTDSLTGWDVHGLWHELKNDNMPQVQRLYRALLIKSNEKKVMQ